MMNFLRDLGPKERSRRKTAPRANLITGVRRKRKISAKNLLLNTVRSFNMTRRALSQGQIPSLQIKAPSRDRF
jgi:hypothetical protein